MGSVRGHQRHMKGANWNRRYVNGVYLGETDQEFRIRLQDEGRLQDMNREFHKMKRDHKMGHRQAWFEIREKYALAIDSAGIEAAVAQMGRRDGIHVEDPELVALSVLKSASSGRRCKINLELQEWVLNHLDCGYSEIDPDGVPGAGAISVLVHARGVGREDFLKNVNAIMRMQTLKANPLGDSADGEVEDDVVDVDLRAALNEAIDDEG